MPRHLRCIRCGACLQCVSGLPAASATRIAAFIPARRRRAVAAVDGRIFREADLPKASSLCGACNESAPSTPIPDLLRLRNKEGENVPSPGTPPMGAWACLRRSRRVARVALRRKVMNYLPTKLIPVPAPPKRGRRAHVPGVARWRI